VACKTKKTDEKVITFEKVSLVNVISNPEKYHKKAIEVKGYFIMESEGDAIYLSKEDCSNMIYKNGIFLFTSKEALSEMGLKPPFKGYVKLRGVFNKNILGSYNFYSGTFDKVIEVSRLLKKGTTNEYNFD
jgi:hypothetical protein